ncbi:DUF1129 family protein [Bacillus sp. DNRA2]|uniref:DUF1129 family protein n=1 Tax=Bacillus sp. DNRA2 TaxID=2723053 RepID=UPI00145E8BD7|nr:DUF1129 family protein [Bacillus sp. DNRA2]NMD71743.1 DUF1129 family protein [Bacillus sp. DNRA2]
MLSKESEQFLVELRLFLISKGKNDQEINEITEELEVHLLEAEASGKDIKHIIGESPKQYMESIGQSMKTDFRQLIVLAPMMILLLASYISIGPAIEGHFSLSKEILMLAAVTGIAGVFVYGILLFKFVPKVFQSRWAYFLIFGAMLLVSGIGVVLLYWFNKQGFEPTFVATPFQNNIILLICVIIFITSAIYTKTWITIIIPILTSIGPIANRFLPEDVNQNPTYILYTSLILSLIVVVAIFLLIRKRKTNGSM